MPRALSPDDIRAQIEALRHSHPDVCDDAEMFQLALESETGVTDFLADVVERMAEAGGHVLAADAIIDGYTERKRHFARRIEALRKLAFGIMQTGDIRKLELTQATLSIKQGTPRVIITDEAALPENVIRIKREPNKVLIKELIDQGLPISGAELSNAEPVLQITGLKRTA